MSKAKRRNSGDTASGDTAMRVDVYVRPSSKHAIVGGMYDGALLVRVSQPARNARATTEALRLVADALDIPNRSVTLVRGAAARRKLIDIVVPQKDISGIERRLAELLSG